MKNAWFIWRSNDYALEGQKTWSNCLKLAWRIAKQNKADVLLSAKKAVKLNKKDIQFNEIYKTYYGYLNTVIYSRLQNSTDTEEAIQDVFVKINNNLNNYDPSKTKLKTWITGIAINTCTDYFRKKMVKRTYNNRYDIEGIEENQTPSTDAADKLIQVKEQKDFHRRLNRTLYNAIERLNTKQKTIILLTLQGYKIDEIASELNVPVGTIKGTKFRAEKELAKMLSAKQELAHV